MKKKEEKHEKKDEKMKKEHKKEHEKKKKQYLDVKPFYIGGVMQIPNDESDTVMFGIACVVLGMLIVIIVGGLWLMQLKFSKQIRYTLLEENMKLIQIAMLSLLSSCAGMDSFFKDADDVLTNNVIEVNVDKEAFVNDDVDVHVSVDVLNKDPKASAPAKQVNNVTIR